MKHIPVLLLAAFATAGFIACKKDNPVPSTGNSNIPLGSLSYRLTGDSSRNWVMQNITINGFPFTGVFPACQLDNVYQYSMVNHAFNITEGDSICDPGNPYSDTGIWNLISDDSLHVVYGCQSENTYRLDMLTHSAMLLRWFTDNGDTIREYYSVVP